jgi:predicted RNA binding protein YcfA (HicA-like mRNA interferase family)
MTLPLISTKKLLKLLVKLNFNVRQGKGSHLVVSGNYKDKNVAFPIPIRNEIGRGLLSKIINEIGITKEEFVILLKEI